MIALIYIMDILELNKRIKSIDKLLLMQQTIEMNEKEIIDLNRQQLSKGIDATGGKIKPKYKRDKKGDVSRYARKKAQMNPTPGLETPDLKLSENLYSEMDLVVGIPNDKAYSITSYVDYLKYLIPKYGDVFNLTKENVEKLKKKITNDYLKLWVKKAGLSS